MKRQEAIVVIESVMPGVNSKEATSGYDTLVFDGKYVKTFNQDISISYPFETPFQTAVKAEDLLKVLKKMEGDDLTISIEAVKEKEDREYCIVSDGKTTLSLSVSSVDIAGHIEDLKLDEIKWKKLPKDFIKGIGMCAFSASKDITFGELSGVYADGKDILSTDNWRASHYTMEGKMEPVIIPSDSASELSKYADLNEYGVGDGWLHLRNAQKVIFSTRLLAGEYPAKDVKAYFDGDLGKKYTFPEGLNKTIERVGLLASSDAASGQDFIKVQFLKDKIKFKGTREYGTIEEEIKVKKGTMPEGVSLDISHKAFLDILPASRDFYLKKVGGDPAKGEDPSSMFVFDIGSFKHLITEIAG